MTEPLTRAEILAIWAILHVRGSHHLAKRVAEVRDSGTRPTELTEETHA